MAGRQVEVEAGLVAASQSQVVVEDLALETLHQGRLDLLPHLARELLLGQDHHDRGAPLQGILPDRDPHLVGVVAGEDGADVVADLLRRSQEELLLRHGVEDRDDLLVVVRSLLDARLVEDPLELVAEDGNLLRILRVGLGGEEAHEPVLSRHATVGVQLLDADVVHSGPAVDGGLGVGLADDQEGSALDERAQAGWEVLQGHGLGVAGLGLVAQDSQARSGLHHQGPLLLRGCLDDVVAPVAQEDEAAVPEPAEEGLDLPELLFLLGEVLHPLGQVGDDLVEGVHHGVEVVGGTDHVLKPSPHLVPDLRPDRLVGDPGHLAVDEALPAAALPGGADSGELPVLVALDPQDRVDVVLDGEVPGVEKLPDRVHDEGPLGDVGAQHRDGSVPPLVVHVGVHDLHVHPVGPGPPQELEGAQGHVGQGVRAPLLQHVGGRLREEEPGELHRQLGDLGLGLPLDLLAYGVDDRRVLADPANRSLRGVAHG